MPQDEFAIYEATAFLSITPLLLLLLLLLCHHKVDRVVLPNVMYVRASYRSVVCGTGHLGSHWKAGSGWTSFFESESVPLYFIECVCRACRIYSSLMNMALHCPLLCLLHTRYQGTWQRSISISVA